MYIIVCEQIASPGSMHEPGCSGTVLWENPEGWDGEEDGQGVQNGGKNKHRVAKNSWERQEGLLQ